MHFLSVTEQKRQSTEGSDGMVDTNLPCSCTEILFYTPFDMTHTLIAYRAKVGPIT